MDAENLQFKVIFKKKRYGNRSQLGKNYFFQFVGNIIIVLI